MPKKPLLSIGMIFKNEIRCLERCMKSLAPLREAIPCELVMADTGSADGSREVAEKYADILFDFPWIDDFAAARNAVIDRCSGTWYFSIDADEWLDEDLGELLFFLRNKKSWTGDAAALTVRNYTRSLQEAGGVYVDLLGIRFALLSTGVRYKGIIHEYFTFPNGRRSKCVTMRSQLLHHDGYIGLNQTAEGALKRRRNMTLLKKQLESEPDSLRAWMELIECTEPDPEHADYVRSAMGLVCEKAPDWDMYGPPVVRHAVRAAFRNDLPEAGEWLQMAEEWFPQSFFTTVDVAYMVCKRCWEHNEYDRCIRYGRMFLRSYAMYDAGEGNQDELLTSTLQYNAPRWPRQIRIYLANAYIYSKNGQEKEALTLLKKLDGSVMDTEQVGNAVRAMAELHAVSDLNTAPLIRKFYQQLITPTPNEKAAEERKDAFEKDARPFFSLRYLQTEENRTDAKRVAATLFAPLECGLGTAASILTAEDPQELENLLGKVEDWESFPLSALAWALEHGAAFPLPGTPLNMEILDALASRLAEDKERFFSLVRMAVERDFSQNVQTLAWIKSLVMAAIQANDWTGPDHNRSMELSCAFAKVERAFLPLCYAPEVFTENFFLLPPLHRFGWYCAQAFEALDAGDAIQYVQLLKQGLAVNPGAKPMVKFLTEYTPQLQEPEPSNELLVLAEQVRIMLSLYAPDDPAVAVLKSSPAYQEVAHLIEGPELGLAGGLAQ